MAAFQDVHKTGSTVIIIIRAGLVPDIDVHVYNSSQKIAFFSLEYD